MPRLAVIAEELGEAGLDEEARERVKPYIEGWLAGTNGNKLVYEQVWGGVCSANGLNDLDADSGNGMYDNHHFHYGYHIYTAELSRESEWYTFTRTKD